MGKFYAFLLGVLAGFGAYHLASSYYVVRTDSGIHWTPKLSQSLHDTYVDIRGFGPKEWVDHPELAAAIAKSGNKQLMETATEGAIDNVLEKVLPAKQPDAPAE